MIPPEPGPDFDAVRRLQAELRSESPRGIVLVSAAMLEEAVRELMLARLVPMSSGSDPLFDGPMSPFGSFSAKIDGAYRLGILSHQFCRDMHIIRRIRNEVAHEPKEFRFEDAGTSARVIALSQSHGIFARSPKWLREHASPSLKDQFLEAATWMLFYMTAERERLTTLQPHALEFGYLASMDDESGLAPDAP
jgi:DNA-binding MltR family transcriptional regulator